MKKPQMNIHDALQRLMAGNSRFQNGLRSIESFHTADKMKDLADNGQSPFGIVLSCSDSRAPADMIFDQGLGDMFVIRVAGNVVSMGQVASIEFAALSFKSPICVVMGHTECGAVKTAISVEKNEKVELTPNLIKLVAKVRPAVRKVMLEGKSRDNKEFVEQATWENVRRAVRLIRAKSPELKELERKKELLVIGAVYDIRTGRVDFDEEALAALEEEKRASIRGKAMQAAVSEIN